MSALTAARVVEVLAEHEHCRLGAQPGDRALTRRSEQLEEEVLRRAAW